MSEINEFDDLLDANPGEQEVEIVEEAVEAEAEPETEETVEAEESEVETTATEKEPWTLSAVLDEREKRQAAVAEAKELREKLKAYEKPDEDGVSVFEDEKGFVENQKRETQEALRNNSLNMSEAFAETVFGEEKVAAAKQWMQSEGIKSPYALDQFNAAKLPYHTIVKLYDDDQVRRDPEAYKAKLREEVLAELEKKPAKSITPSLASKRSVGNSKTSSDDFEDILGA